MLKKAWPGKNTFCCNGRFLKGAEFYKTIITSSILILYSSILCAFPSKYFYSKTNSTPLILTILLTLLCSSLFFITSTKDPGYIPKQIFPYAPKYNKNLNENLSSIKPLSFVLNSSIVKVKFCRTCMIFRPPRCSHCSICDLCIEGFDHHCPWIGNCIGKRNYWYFFFLLIMANLLCIEGVVICICHVYKKIGGFEYEEIVSIVMAAFGVLALIFLLPLLGFHVYLCELGMTTNEDVKDIWISTIFNPFNKGSCLRNLKFKYQEFRTAPQYNVREDILEYEEDVNANAVHRKVVVNQISPGFSHTFEEISNTIVIKT